jgi:hypothetical protein
MADGRRWDTVRAGLDLSEKISISLLDSGLRWDAEEQRCQCLGGGRLPALEHGFGHRELGHRAQLLPLPCSVAATADVSSWLLACCFLGLRLPTMATRLQPQCLCYLHCKASPIQFSVIFFAIV